MKVEDILRNKVGRRVKNAPKICQTDLTGADLEPDRRLQVIPSRISTYFHREKILAVYKCASREYEYYLILTIDGTIFEIYNGNEIANLPDY